MKRSFMMVDLLTNSEENRSEDRNRKSSPGTGADQASDDWKTSRSGKIAREDEPPAPGCDNSAVRDSQARQSDVLHLLPSSSTTIETSLSIEIETKAGQNIDKDDEEDRSSDSPGESH